MNENIYDSVDVIEESTKEVKNASKKEKKSKLFKKAVIITGVAAIAGGIAYFFGYKCGCKDMLSTDTMEMLKERSRTAGANCFIDTIVSTCKEGYDVATKHDNGDGTNSYLSYTLLDTAPEWWVGNKGVYTKDIVN